ncbi:hypothetical protein RDWZM_005468 [Blomia tropicalis]|uniref:Uncharacterized protein n=1 Tax=Blomia tropicalis TaxID=40697 RepID=A0A9Q0RNH2_BLOTA|nr:hypothetical protein RDWZM_005468 [Blomia tropicalis]
MASIAYGIHPSNDIRIWRRGIKEQHLKIFVKMSTLDDNNEAKENCSTKRPFDFYLQCFYHNSVLLNEKPVEIDVCYLLKDLDEIEVGGKILLIIFNADHLLIEKRKFILDCDQKENKQINGSQKTVKRKNRTPSIIPVVEKDSIQFSAIQNFKMIEETKETTLFFTPVAECKPEHRENMDSQKFPSSKDSLQVGTLFQKTPFYDCQESIIKNRNETFQTIATPKGLRNSAARRKNLENELEVSNNFSKNDGIISQQNFENFSNSQVNLNDHCANDDEQKQLFQPETPKADYETNVNFGLKKLISQTKTPNSDYIHNVSGVKFLVQPKTPKADYEANVDFGLKKLISQSDTQNASYIHNVSGVKFLVEPKTPKADYETNVDFGLKQIYNDNQFESNSKYDANFTGIGKMLAVRNNSSPVPDYESNVDFGLKQMYNDNQFKSKSKYDANFTGIGKMLAVRNNSSPVPDYETNVDFGLKKLISQSDTQNASYIHNVSGIYNDNQFESNSKYDANFTGIGKMLAVRNNSSPVPDYESNVDFGLKQMYNDNQFKSKSKYDANFTGIGKMLAVRNNSSPVPDYETNVDFGVKQIFNNNQFKSKSKYDANFTGIGKMLAVRNNSSPVPDYESNVDFGLKQMYNDNQFKSKSKYDANFTGIGKMLAVRNNSSPVPDYESNVDFGLKQMYNDNQFKSKSKYDANFTGIGKMLAVRNNSSPVPDYESNVDFGLKQIFNDNQFKSKSKYDANFTGIGKMLAVRNNSSPVPDYDLNASALKYIFSDEEIFQVNKASGRKTKKIKSDIDINQVRVTPARKAKTKANLNFSNVKAEIEEEILQIHNDEPEPKKKNARAKKTKTKIEETSFEIKEVPKTRRRLRANQKSNLDNAPSVPKTRNRTRTNRRKLVVDEIGEEAGFVEDKGCIQINNLIGDLITQPETDCSTSGMTTRNRRKKERIDLIDLTELEIDHSPIQTKHSSKRSKKITKKK